MLYVSKACGFDLTITDSETCESFIVNVGLNNFNVFYRDGNIFNMRCVLGYIEGHIAEVPKELMTLLSYVGSISYRSCENLSGAILVCDGRITELDKYNIMFVTESHKSYTIFDAIMCASYSDYFWAFVETGVLILCFGYQNYLVVTFCGEYMPYVSKMVAMCRGIWEKGISLSSNTFGMSQLR